MHKHTFKAAKEFCRTLRKNQTAAESSLWENFRNRKFLGKKFLRQHPIFITHPSGKESFYIADFYCSEYCLVIELDGRSHFYQQEYDEARTDILHDIGLTVVRFRNEEVEYDLEKVLKKIKELMAKKLTL